MQTSIIVKHIFEGLHFWNDAPTKVSWLRLLHHHNFVVRAKIAVVHDDRELEYFMVQSELEKWCNQLKPLIRSEGYSCETIAKKLIEVIKLKYGERAIAVTVHEDDNHGSEVVYEPEVTII